MEIVRRMTGGVIYYACEELNRKGAAHGFSTRFGGVSAPPWESLNLGANRGDDPDAVAENFRRFCAAIGTHVDALVKNHQVHGDMIRAVTRADVMSTPSDPGVFEADGLITNEPGVCLTVFSGDCVPILLFDPVKKVVAAAHAGWRGTALGTAARAAEKMQNDYGSAGEDILAAIGPAISQCCFETHADVPEGLLKGLGDEAQSYIQPLPGGEKYQVDLKGANVCWLEKSGLLREHIAVCTACTACLESEFWSHRRLGGRRGSMAAMIELKR